MLLFSASANANANASVVGEEWWHTVLFLLFTGGFWHMHIVATICQIEQPYSAQPTEMKFMEASRFHWTSPNRASTAPVHVDVCAVFVLGETMRR